MATEVVLDFSGTGFDNDDGQLETLQLSLELDCALTKVFENKDPLDSSDFDPLEYINLMFPDEESLAQAESVLGKLHERIKQMDREMHELVRGQLDSGERGKKEIEATQFAIQELFNNIKRIKSQAASSERMVQEITRDIKSLDHAKKNLTSSVTVLRRLQMLVTAVEQLRGVTEKKKYVETAQLLQVVNQLLEHFKSYRSVDQIARFLDAIAQLQMTIRRQIFHDFDNGFSGALRSSIGQLSDACLVINILDGDAKKALIDWYCELHLKDYRSIFRSNPEVAGLGDVSRRYAWIKRLLKTHDEEHAVIFPPEWKIAEALCEKFCQDTRRDLGEVLAKADSNMDVKVMLQALQTSIEFEGKLFTRFGPKNFEEEGINAKIKADSKFYKIISSVFDPYLRHYVEMEDKALSDIMDQYRARPILQEEESVLSSSTDLFYLYRQTLVQCAKLSTNKPFLDLVRLFGKWLRQYSELLQAKLPKDDKKAISEDEIRTACLIINTADYCTTTTSQLEEKLAEKIDEEFRPLVNFNRERDSFLDVATAGTKFLVHGVENCVEPALNAMLRRPWGSIEAVGDQSEYVSMIAQALSGTVGTVRKSFATNTKYFRTFCDKFAETILTRYYNNIFKCKPISEVGAEQLLLDTHALKTILTQMVNINSQGPAQPPALYVKILGKSVAKLEQLLKVVLRPYQPVEGIVETYLLLHTDHSISNFQKILELKGLKRQEHQIVLEAFQRRISMEVGTNPSTSGSTANLSGSTPDIQTFAPSTPGGSTTGAKFEMGFRKFVAGMNMKR
ncbi:Vps53-like protein [Phlyctochytrium arcticum]|nr:Vps53-like protein [Phlyctochytrium arcticum]